ncbi:S-adenosyl-L-methionine-dependent methyltransferases superfamily protein [Tanacetum coccineum]|uniref:S-adenosyl-L-methionine-dependent methyltransferases superfamily protein n=1 Tax=Tanacetum coccineum TaxID=301880 RepID=A0ABQ5HE89_9ASTR
MKACKEKNLKPPQYQVCLNDLFINDFNSVFESLPMFYAKHKKEKGENSPCYVSAVPGSFHGRLFPDQSLPKGIENNKLNINIRKTSPPNVFENYKKQFQKDVTTFLESRSIEIVHGGRMVLTLAGRSDVDPCGNEGGQISNLIARSLVDLVKEGLIQESDINSFNIPAYNACSDEIREIIHSQGSFSLDILETFGVDMDPYGAGYENEKVSDEPINHGKRAAKIMRAAIEPVLVAHFGNSAMDLLFKKLEKNVDEHLATETTKNKNNVHHLPERCWLLQKGQFPEIAMRKVEPIIKETVKSIVNFYGFPQCFNIADLGCSTGPNTLLAISNIIDGVHEVPKGIENNGLNLYISKTSPPNVFENYKIQFQKDFTTFLDSRSIEIVCGGRMALTFVGRSTFDPCSSGSGHVSELVVKSLVDAINEGLVRESDLYSLNVPLYYAYAD